LSEERRVRDIPVEDLEDLYEFAPCGYLSLGADGRIVKSNRTLASWTGYEPEQLLGKRLRELLNVAGQMFYETHFAPLLRMQGFFNEVALDIVRADGSIVHVLANAAERRDATGALMFTRLTMFQASDRRRYERDLVIAKETAQAGQKLAEGRLLEEHEATELREQFIAVLGHDLRNPLAAIDGGINILVREPQSDKSVRVIGLMRGSIVRMNGLISNILDFARGRLGGGIALNNTSEPLEATLAQVVAEIRSGFPERVIEIEMHLDRLITADHGRLAQMFSNLLANAITHGAHDQPIRLNASNVDERLEVTVANGGKPIPPAVMDRLFQPFYRGHASSAIQGLGLGLYISSVIADAHGGRLDVTSNDDETRFTFSMPLEPPT
jgi:sigma-B regulation protein RsbU (phosphoserine phosphatase)